MASNEHPDMSGNPCDQPFECYWCGKYINEEDSFGSIADDDKLFCSDECVFAFEDDLACGQDFRGE